MDRYLAVIVTGTQAGHIYQLQQAGAVVIWPLNDPAGTTDTWDLVNDRQAFVWGPAEYGVPGPFPEATALNIWGGSGFGTPGSSGIGSWGQELTPLDRQVRRSTFTWWMARPGEQSSWWANITLNAPDESSTTTPGWYWMPFWAGNTYGPGADWGFTGGHNIFGGNHFNVFPSHGSWLFLAGTLDADDTTMSPAGTGRLYWNGAQVAIGGVIDWLPIGSQIWRGFNIGGDNVSFANLALFDRVLTANEIETLWRSQEPGPPVEGMTKVWDGTQWVTGTAKGWDGNQWRQARIWTGEDWR